MRRLQAVVFFLCISALPVAARSPAAVISGTTAIDGHTVHYVIARLDRVSVRVVLGDDLVGRTEPLAHMAERYHATAAINGGYFEAYGHRRIKNLIHTMVVDGSLVFKGDVGSILYFDRANHAAIERIPLRIEGSLDGSFAYPNNWYAYWINRLPGPTGETITIFTSAWGPATGLDGGPQVQVTGGVVTAMGDGSMRIPPNGYVVYFRGEESVAQHFRVGRRAYYDVVRADGGNLGPFSQAWEAMGCGPQLLVNGRAFADAAAEGFADPKVYGSVARSMVGISRDGSELILATSSGTLLQMAEIAKRLGAYNAMNLDGGASSGLWVAGHFLTQPGRDLASALIVR
jgi:hypothetical protein